MVNSFDIKRYSISAAGYILSSLSENELSSIQYVILFGSVAGGTASEESDVDLFFDYDAPKSRQLKLRSKINKICDAFYLTNVALRFKLNKVDNEINVIVGKLSEWKELSRSISSNGIILYGKFSKIPPETKAYTIFAWENLGKEKGAFLNKIYGYKVKKKKYPGLLKKIGGKRLGKASIIIPAEKRDNITQILEGYKINYSRYDVWK